MLSSMVDQLPCRAGSHAHGHDGVLDSYMGSRYLPLMTVSVIQCSIPGHGALCSYHDDRQFANHLLAMWSDVVHWPDDVVDARLGYVDQILIVSIMKTSYMSR